MTKQSKNIVIFILFVFMNFSIFNANALKFDDIKSLIFTKKERQELTNWSFEALRLGGDTKIYTQILQEKLIKSRAAEDEYILSQQTNEEQCEAFIRIFEYKNGIDVKGGQTSLRQNYQEAGESQIKTVIKNQNFLDLCIGDRIFSKELKA